MMFAFVRSVIFDTFQTLSTAQESRVSLFLTIFVLWDTGIHVSITYSCNMISDVEGSINGILSLEPTLSIPYVNLDNCHIRFR